MKGHSIPVLILWLLGFAVCLTCAVAAMTFGDWGAIVVLTPAALVIGWRNRNRSTLDDNNVLRR